MVPDRGGKLAVCPKSRGPVLALEIFPPAPLLLPTPSLFRGTLRLALRPAGCGLTTSSASSVFCSLVPPLLSLVTLSGDNGLSLSSGPRCVWVPECETPRDPVWVLTLLPVTFLELVVLGLAQAAVFWWRRGPLATGSTPCGAKPFNPGNPDERPKHMMILLRSCHWTGCGTEALWPSSEQNRACDLCKLVLDCH